MNVLHCQNAHLSQIMETLPVQQMNNGVNAVDVKEAVITKTQYAHFNADLLDVTVTREIT